jgi:hypothetical protein
MAVRLESLATLEALGYLFAPVPAAPDYHVFARPPERPRTHHLHVCAAASHQERHPQDRLAYMAANEAYVVALEARACAGRRERDARAVAGRRRRIGFGS